LFRFKVNATWLVIGGGLVGLVCATFVTTFLAELC